MKKFYFVFLLMPMLWACSKEDDGTKDMTKPVIVSDNQTSNPINCQVYAKGEIITVRYTFTDNEELGKYNIEIHNNFDHHSHSTEAEECEMNEVVKPVKPWVFNRDYSIPAASKSYTTNDKIEIPADIDAGDYHFMIRLTDKSGWQEIKSVSIKIVEKSE